MPVEKYFYDGDTVLQVYDDSGVTLREYTSTGGRHGDILSEFDGTSTRYFEPDGLGSTDALTDDLQTVTDRWKYGAFGSATQTVGSDPMPYLFVGRHGYRKDDETGIYLLGSGTRYYDPVTAQFLSEDPIGFAGGDANIRRYVGNNPINRVDPSGLACGTCEVKEFEIYDKKPCGYYKQIYDAKDLVGGGYRIKAVFTDPGCKCCEFRQEVKGSVEIDQQRVSRTSRDNYAEDDPPYGHRSGFPNLTVDYYGWLLPDLQTPALSAVERLFGCFYFMEDNPGWGPAAARAKLKGKTLTFDVDLKFRVRIIDTCHGDKTVKEKEFPIKCIVKIDKDGNVVKE